MHPDIATCCIVALPSSAFIMQLQLVLCGIPPHQADTLVVMLTHKATFQTKLTEEPRWCFCVCTMLVSVLWRIGSVVTSLSAH